jgi:uncharacterized phage-associated protein
LRQRLPSIGVVKLHKLLYYCQGHHLATFGRPLFSDTISAWDMGPVVGTLWREEKDGQPPDEQGLLPAELGEAELNTIGYVVSRYGRMTGRELEILTHGESPWQRANDRRRPGTRTRIELSWIDEYFREADAADREEERVPLDSDEISRFLAGAGERREEQGQLDSMEEIQRRLAEARARRGAGA